MLNVSNIYIAKLPANIFQTRCRCRSCARRGLGRRQAWICWEAGISRIVWRDSWMVTSGASLDRGRDRGCDQQQPPAHQHAPSPWKKKRKSKSVTSRENGKLFVSYDIMRLLFFIQTLDKTFKNSHNIENIHTCLCWRRFHKSEILIQLYRARNTLDKEAWNSRR